MKGTDGRIDRCDALDMLEEAVLTRRPLTITVEGGKQVTGRVVEVITERGEDHALIEGGQRIGVSRIVEIDKDSLGEHTPVA
jgi:transcriptional antiterminator Rof (Rho-off)